MRMRSGVSVTVDALDLGFKEMIFCESVLFRAEVYAEEICAAGDRGAAAREITLTLIRVQCII